MAPDAVTAYLELADCLLIAERMLGLPPEASASFDRIGLADSARAAPRAGFGGVEAHPDFETKAIVLGWHLAKSHPLPHGTSDARSSLPWSSSSATAERGASAWRSGLRYQLTTISSGCPFGPAIRCLWFACDGNHPVALWSPSGAVIVLRKARGLTSCESRK